MADNVTQFPALPRPPGFGKGKQKTGGRSKGRGNKMPRMLKEAIIMAVELEGSDGEGKGKMVGFMRRLAREDIRTFATLVRAVIPLQVESQHDDVVEVTYKTVTEVRRELESRGITMELVANVLNGSIEEADMVEIDDEPAPNDEPAKE